MRYGKALRILALGSVVSLLVAVIPATPVLAAPLITLSPTSGAIGTKVTITGNNFDSYIGDSFLILFDDTEIAELTVPETGSFSLNFVIPAGASPGRAWITVKSELDFVIAQNSFIIAKTEINLDTNRGAVGTTVAIEGRGFYVEKIVTFYYSYNGDRTRLGTVTAGPTGECSFSFTIPESPVGKHEVSGVGAEGNSAEAEFMVIPSFSLEPTSGAVADVVTANGQGLAKRSAITIYFKDTEVAHAKTDEYGSFEIIFKVPPMKSSTYEVKAEDEAANSAKVIFTIVEASLSQTTGNIGTPLIVSGAGFRVGKTITVKYDEQEMAQATAGSGGSFSVAFNVPASVSGEHVITVSDDINTYQLIFTVESEPPPTPSPQLPETGVKATSPLHFDWTDVTDDSLPVTYDLQIATSQDFTTETIVLAKAGLNTSEYTLTEDETLAPVSKKEPYYWRVKAVDAAANESLWSTPRSFYVSAPFALRGWVLYVLIGLGAILLGLLLFWIGRRTAYYRPQLML